MYNCIKGYKLNVESNRSRICQADGTWSGKKIFL